MDKRGEIKEHLKAMRQDKPGERHPILDKDLLDQEKNVGRGLSKDEELERDVRQFLMFSDVIACKPQQK
jgi:hypothetical protein